MVCADRLNSKSISIALNSTASALSGLLIYLLARKQVAANGKVKMASPSDAYNYCRLPISTRWRETMAAA